MKILRHRLGRRLTTKVITEVPAPHPCVTRTRTIDGFVYSASLGGTACEGCESFSVELTEKELESLVAHFSHYRERIEGEDQSKAAAQDMEMRKAFADHFPQLDAGPIDGEDCAPPDRINPHVMMND